MGPNIKSGGNGKNELSANDTTNSARSAFGERAAFIIFDFRPESMARR
jgi:hypothetical protein